MKKTPACCETNDAISNTGEIWRKKIIKCFCNHGYMEAVPVIQFIQWKLYKKLMQCKSFVHNLHKMYHQFLES